jgi:hypothetical protein
VGAMKASGRAAIFLAVMGSASAAFAQAPVAVVEDVQGKTAGVELMDYVTPGQKITLGSGDSIVLGYVKSCWRETISGGTVTVGAEQSTVEGGKVERTKVACDSGKISLAPPQAGKAGGMVFRDMPGTRPQFILYGSSPLIEAKGGGMLVIERTDQRGERHDVSIAAGALLRGSFYDFAKSDKQLTPGGIYRARLGAQQIVFKVDPLAKPGRTAIIGRLIRFAPAS